RHPGLVHENEAFGLDRLDLLGELAPLLLDFGGVLLGGVWGFLLQRQAELLQGPADDHPAAGDAHLLAERLERGVGRLLNKATEPLQGVAIEGGGDAAGVGPGPIGAGLAAESEQFGDGRRVNFEPYCELPPGTLFVVNGVEDTLTEIIRQG